MTTLTIKINPRSKKGKAFLAFTKSFVTNDKDIEIIETDDVEEKSPYNPEFVKMILDADKRGNYTTLDSKDIWGSLGLK